MLRRSLTSYWTAAILGLVLLGVYIAWGVWWEPGKRGEVVTGFGASLVVLGIFLAAHPFIRAGIRKTAASQVRSPGLSFYGSADRARNEEMMAPYRAAVAAAVPDVVAERIVAVAVIILSTLLNGYGAPIARLLGWELPTP